MHIRTHIYIIYIYIYISHDVSYASTIEDLDLFLYFSPSKPYEIHHGTVAIACTALLSSLRVENEVIGDVLG